MTLIGYVLSLLWDLCSVQYVLFNHVVGCVSWT